MAPTYIALLRAVNLAGRNKVSMSDLRMLFDRLGMGDARTVLQSGNVVFSTEKTPTAELEKLLEKATEEQLGLRTDFFVRTTAEWQKVIEANPFAAEAERDPGHLLVLFLKEGPEANAVGSMKEAIPGGELVEVNGREAYIHYPDGIGRSKLTNALIEKKLRTRGTGRNWNTVLKLGELSKSI